MTSLHWTSSPNGPPLLASSAKCMCSSFANRPMWIKIWKAKIVHWASQTKWFNNGHFERRKSEVLSKRFQAFYFLPRNMPNWIPGLDDYPVTQHTVTKQWPTTNQVTGVTYFWCSYIFTYTGIPSFVLFLSNLSFFSETKMRFASEATSVWYVFLSIEIWLDCHPLRDLKGLPHLFSLNPAKTKTL